MSRLVYLREPKKLPAKTSVAYVGSTLAEKTPSTTHSITVPAAAQVGDLLVYAMTVATSVTITPPAGLVFVGSFTTGAASNTTYVWSRYVQNLAEAGATFDWTSSANTSSVAACAAYRGVGGYSVIPNIYQSTSNEALNNRPPRFPSVWAGPHDMVVGISGTLSYLSTSATACVVTAAPSGWNLRQTGSEPTNPLAVPRGLAVMDVAGPRTPAYETYTLTSNCHNAGLVMALSPVSPRWSEIERVPSTLQAKPVVVYGSSSSAFVANPNAGEYGYCSRTPWGERLITGLGQNTNSRNMSLPGARAEDICAGVHGTRSYSTRAVSGDPLAISRAITWAGLPAPTASVFVMDLAGNNVISMADSAQEQAGVVHAVRSILTRIRAAAFIGIGSGLLAYTGTWSNVATDGATGGVVKRTTTPGDKVVYSFTNSLAEPWSVVLKVLGGDNTAAGNTGASYRVLLDGVEVLTGTTHDQMKATGWGGGPAYGFVQMALTVPDIPPGAHTITLEHTGTSGSVLMLDSVETPSQTPPWAVVLALHQMPAAAYTSFPELSQAKQDAYRDLIRGVCEEFTDGRAIFYDPSASGLWDPDAYTVEDLVHQSEQGHAHDAHEILRVLSERVQ